MEITVLEEILSQTNSKIEKIDAINSFCMETIDNHNSEQFTKRVFECQNLLKGIKYPKGKAYNDVSLAYHYWGKFDLENAEKCTNESLEIFEKLKVKDGLLMALCVGTFAYLAKGNYDAAFKYCISGIRASEDFSDNSTKGWVNYTMGIMYFDTKDYEKSLKYYQKALDVFSNIDHTYGMARSCSGVGSSYLELDDYDNALEKINQSVVWFKELENASGLSRVYNDLGVLYKRTGEYSKAKDYLYLALEIRRSIKNIQATTTSLVELGELFCHEGNHEEAVKITTEALNLAKEKNAKPKELKAHKILYIANKDFGNIPKAFEHLEEFVKLKEEVSGAEITQQLKIQESNFASEKAEQEAEIERLKNVELKSAHDMISEKNKEITDSINYAKRIQAAILPPMHQFKKLFNDFFVLYKPKDIIAGDFYWLDIIDDTVLFAAADCTGHGVPGAMVSVVCNNSLNRSVREYSLSKPSDILEKTTDLVVEQFEAGEEIIAEAYCDEVKDGMDIALCSLEGNKLQYSGANNPLWILRNGEILETKPNKQPIGKFDYRKPFVNHEFDLEKGDIVYVFSDGYVDQFGGEKGKKFKAKALKELLLSIYNEPMLRQKEILDESFEQWRGDIEQIDDVCIIGVKR